MTREYVLNERICSYQLYKTTTYETEEYAYNAVKRLDLLRDARFEWLKIPRFEYTIDGCSVTINTDYIKGWYCTEPLKLYDEIVLREGDTFTDPHPSNFITCSRTLETYAIDLDSYTTKPDDMHDVFMRKWKNKVQSHEAMIQQLGELS